MVGAAKAMMAGKYSGHRHLAGAFFHAIFRIILTGYDLE